MFKKLSSAFFVSAGLMAAAPAAAQTAAEIAENELSKRAATTQEMASCTSRTDSSQNFRFLGFTDDPVKPLDFLMCTTGDAPEVWSMSCEMTAIFMEVMAYPSRVEELRQIGARLLPQLDEGASSCRALFMS